MVRALLVLAVVLSAACARPASRAATPTLIAEPTPAIAAEVEQLLLTPSLTPPAAPTDRPPPSATATPRPEDLPLVRGLEPAPDTEVRMGEVRIAAEITARGSLTQVITSLNALPVRTDIEVRDAHTWRAVVTRALEPGAYEVRLVALDDRRRMTDQRWRFKVLPPPTATPTQTPTPTATPTPAPTATLTPVPTGSPTLPSTPAPRSVELATTTPVVLTLPTPRGTQDNRVQMPLVRGMRAEDARTQLQRLGLRVESRVVQSPAPKDIVVEQAPAAGTSLASGAGVTLSVSAGR